MLCARKNRCFPKKIDVLQKKSLLFKKNRSAAKKILARQKKSMGLPVTGH